MCRLLLASAATVMDYDSLSLWKRLLKLLSIINKRLYKNIIISKIGGDPSCGEGA